AYFRQAIEHGAKAEAAWNANISAYRNAFPDFAKEFEEVRLGAAPLNWEADIPIFPADAKGMATRVASGKVMNAIAPRLPALIGGSADLDPSTFTALKGLGDFEAP